MNTGLGTGDVPLGEGFLAWPAFSNSKPDMDIAALMKRAVPSLSDAEAAAYAAPYPDARYKPSVRRFPNLVPDRPDAGGAALSRRARDFWSRNGPARASWRSACRTRFWGRQRCGRCTRASAIARRRWSLPTPGHFVSGSRRHHRREGDGEFRWVRTAIIGGRPDEWSNGPRLD